MATREPAGAAPALRIVELTFVGTATLLLRLGPFTLLTDPNFLHRGDRARLGWGLRSTRITEPALSIEDLPSLDAVVLSHHHGDHFDDVAAERLDPFVPIVTTSHAVRKLRRQGFREPHALETWGTWSSTKDDVNLTVTAVPARHAPAPLRWALPPTMGSVLELREGDERVARLYVSGDALLDGSMFEIAQRFPAPDVAVLHLGGTRIAGVLLTMDGSQGREAMRRIGAATTIPVHHEDYTVFRSSLGDFLAEVRRDGAATEVVTLERGQTYRLPRA